MSRINIGKTIVNWIDRLVCRPHPVPIIVLGTQKTGTSAIAHLLADGCGLSKTIDIPEVWGPGVARFLSDRSELSRTIARFPRPFSRALIKEPNLTFLFDDLRRVFPRAQFVFVNRDPRDTLRSLLNRLGVPGDLDRLDPREWGISDSWAHVFDRTVWSYRSDFYIEALAERWARAADVYLQNADDMVLVKYEAFRADKVGVIAEVARKLEKPSVRNISGIADIQYQPRGNRGVSWLEFFGEKNLKRLEDVCAERMKRLGYALSTEQTTR